MSLIRMKYKMRRAIRPFLWAFLAVFVVSIFFGYGSYQTGVQAQAKPIVRVNDQDVPREAYDQVFSRFRNFLGARGGSLGSQMLYAGLAYDNLVEEFLRAQAAAPMGVQISHRDVRDEIDAQVDLQLNDIGQGLTGPEREEEEGRLRQAPDLQPDVVERRLIAQQLDEKLRAKARPVEVKVSQILFKSDKRTKAQAFSLARQTYEQASASGANFAALAKKQSEDDATKTQGGDLGWLKPDSSRPGALVGAAFQLKKGDVSQPVPVPEGYAVLKVTEERAYTSTKKDQKEKDADLESYKSQVAGKIVEGYYEVLKANAKVEPLDPFFKAIAAEKEVDLTVETSASSPKGKAKLEEAIRNFELAKKEWGQYIGPGYDLHLGKHYERVERYDDAERSLREVMKRDSGLEVQMALGEVLEKKKDTKGAVAAYQEASRTAWNRQDIHGELAEKFRKLGRPDLAKQEAAKHKKYEANQKAESARREALQKQQEEQRKKEEAARKKAEEAKKKEEAAKKKAEAASPAATPAVPKPVEIKPTPANSAPQKP